MTVYGAMLETESYFAMSSNPAYNFATGDFSLAAMVMTQTGGPVVSRILQGRGFLLIVNPDSTTTFLTRDRSGTYQVTSGETGILDGSCHTLVAIRRGTSMEILLDGSVLPATGSGTGTPPLNVNNNEPLLIGVTTMVEQPSIRQFVGMVMNVGVWNCALQGDQIVQASFARDVEDNPNLQGYWTLDNITADLSPNQNVAQQYGPTFSPCVSCVWTSGVNDYDFCQMSADGLQDEPISQLHTLQVEEGVPALFFSIMSNSDQPAFPTGASVSLTDPTGQTYKQNVNSDEVFVATQDGQPWGVAIVNPQAGPWQVSVTAPPSVGFLLQFQTCPTGDVVPTIEDALTPLYGPTSNTPEGNVGGWLSFLEKVAVAAVAGVVVAGLIIVSGGGALPAVAAGVGAFAAVGHAQVQLALRQINSGNLNQAAKQIGGMAGFLVSVDTLLLIDANNAGDPATEKPYQARKDTLYPYVTASIFNKNQKSLIEMDDKRTKVKAALLSFGTGYVTANGHGQESYLMGCYKSGNQPPFEEVLATGRYDPAEVRGKIIHLLACRCGDTNPGGLGLDVVQNGAVAFFGYSGPFILSTTPMYRAYCSCDIEVDKALIDGKTCEEAYQAAIAAYNKFIAKCQKNGDYADAAALETDRDRLVAPSVDPGFGDKNARLAAPVPMRSTRSPASLSPRVGN